jgi:hypothetical protein
MRTHLPASLVFAAALLSVALHETPAHAQVAPGDTSAVGVVFLSAADAALLPPLVADGAYVAQHRRAGIAWPVMGFVFGAGAIGLGLAYALPNAGSSDSFASAEIALGVTTAVLGAADIGLGIASLAMPRRFRGAASARATRWTVSPIVLRDRTGAAAPGAVVSVVRF